MMQYDVDELGRQGFSCSQIMLIMTMELIGMEEDEFLVRASRGLSLGMGVGHACGIVTGAACAFSLACGAQGISQLFPLFYEWFYDSYGQDCGSINCNELLAGDFNDRMRICPDMIRESWKMAEALLTRRK
jgi:hypothetical protein